MLVSPGSLLVTDMMNREVSVPALPKRIVSLVPSQTELLFDLGLVDRIVGVTKFCIHPGEKTAKKTKIGGTKDFRFERIKALQPDLIIGNKEENYEEGITRLAEKYPVWMSDITDLESALRMITGVGSITGKTSESEELAKKIKGAFALLEPFSNPSAAYFIWRNPYMAAGRFTFIQDMLQRLGLHNVFAGNTGRYPEISIEELVSANPEIVLLSSEPYPFGEKHLAEIKAFLPASRILLVDGEMFSWYGSRLLLAPDYFQKLKSDLN